MVLGAADPTNPALVAVEMSFRSAIGKRNFIVQKDTDGAPIGAEDCLTGAIVAGLMGFLDPAWAAFSDHQRAQRRVSPRVSW
jgi:hypothetical protein